MNNTKKLLLVLLTTVLSMNVAIAPKIIDKSENKPPVQKAKNVILMIGDGMGLTQISAGMFMNNNRLNLERFKVVGIHKPYSSDNLITDSAAGATAFACGQKTYNGAIGVGKDSTVYKTILEEAEEKGLATGLIATSTIVHATPASFIAHVDHRQKYEEIAEFFLETEIDLFVGGGKKYFDNRKDKRDLYKELLKKGYSVSDYYLTDFNEFFFPKKKNVAFFTSLDEPLPRMQGRDYLQLASKRATSHLKARSEEGFFLMIEGSQIDWGGHSNNSKFLVSEMLDFDQTIGAVLDFAEKDGETLVIVTADHECGGYSILAGSRFGNLKTNFSTVGHTADLIPVFAYGPGSEDFGGIYENTAIYSKMRAAYGWE